MGGGASKKAAAKKAYEEKEKEKVAEKEKEEVAAGARRRSSLMAAQKKLSATSAMEDGDPNKAIEHYTEAIKLSTAAGDEDDSSRGIYFANRAQCYYQLENWTKAADDCEAAIKLTPFLMRVWRLLGQARFRLGELPAAKQALENALKFDDSDAESKTSLAEVLEAIAANGGGDAANGGGDAAETPAAAEAPET